MNSSSLCATNQKQSQRRVQNQREAFAQEAVLEELVTQEGAMHFEGWLFVSSLLLLLSIFAWKVSSRLGIPALLLFLKAFSGGI